MGIIITIVFVLVGGTIFLTEMNFNVKSVNPNPNYVKLHQFLNKERVEKKLIK